MTSVTECFARLRDRGECALIPFITAGDPNLEITEQALLALDQNGADLIELGVPYSDPLADGPVIQAAATRALANGTSLEKVLAMLRRLIPQLSAPIILFTYYNPIYKRGTEAFLAKIADVGVRGLVIPDLPLEEAEPLLAAAKANQIEVTLLVAPTSSKDRILRIAESSQGFIYLVSTTGVTGVRSKIESRVQDLLHELRQVTDKPIGVGFGISQPEHAQQVQAWGADAAIVGSAFVKRLNHVNPAQGVQELTAFCQSLKKSLGQAQC
ncbi:MAG: tryptophan synthase subunit alpha [Cyanobacteria bacterium P01_F01_bin.42]